MVSQQPLRNVGKVGGTYESEDVLRWSVGSHLYIALVPEPASAPESVGSRRRALSSWYDAQQVRATREGGETRRVERCSEADDLRKAVLLLRQ